MSNKILAAILIFTVVSLFFPFLWVTVSFAFWVLLPLEGLYVFSRFGVVFGGVVATCFWISTDSEGN